MFIYKFVSRKFFVALTGIAACCFRPDVAIHIAAIASVFIAGQAYVNKHQ